MTSPVDGEMKAFVFAKTIVKVPARGNVTMNIYLTIIVSHDCFRSNRMAYSAYYTNTARPVYKHDSTIPSPGIEEMSKSILKQHIDS